MRKTILGVMGKLFLVAVVTAVAVFVVYGTIYLTHIEHRTPLYLYVGTLIAALWGARVGFRAVQSSKLWLKGLAASAAGLGTAVVSLNLTLLAIVNTMGA